MMDTTIFGKIFIAAAFCGFIALFVYHFKRRRLYWAAAQFPGPLALPLVGNVFSFVGNTADILTSLLKILNYRGSLPCRVWLGPKLCIMMWDVELVKWPPGSIIRTEEITDHRDLLNPQTVLTSRKALDKTDIHTFGASWVGTGLLTAPGSKWCRTRKLIAPAFNPQILKSWVKVFAEQSKIMTIQIRKELHCGEFDIAGYLWPYSLDLICETVMDVSLKAQTDKHCRYHHFPSRLLEIIFSRMMKVWLHSDFIFNRTKMGREQAECLKYMQSITSDIIRKKKIERRTNNEGSPEDKPATNKGFLDLLMEKTDNGTKLTDEEVRTEIDTMIIAGTDATATTNLFIMLILATHPEVQDKVFQELCEIYGDEVCSERPVVYEDLNRMEYLERVIKETMRIFPIGPMIGRKCNEDLDFGKFTLPKGCTTIIGIFMIHRSEKYWSDPLKFNPDRFLPEEVAKRHPYSYLPFSNGPRICIGKTFAMMSMKVLIATVLRRYVLKKDKIDNVKDIKLKVNFVVKPQKNVTISISERRYPGKLCKERNNDDNSTV